MSTAMIVLDETEAGAALDPAPSPTRLGAQTRADLCPPLPPRMPPKAPLSMPVWHWHRGLRNDIAA